LPSDRAVVFTNNHDTQRNAAIFYQDGTRYDLANVFLLAWPYGYPKLMSSFAFDRSTDLGRAEGPPSDAEGNTRPIYAQSGSPDCATDAATVSVGQWVCEHRASYVANMVRFRRETVGTPVVNWWDNGANQIAFGRGDRGFVVLNGEPSPLAQSFVTGLPQGDYCDVVGGGVDAGSCVGTVVHVDATGQADFSLGPNSAQAIHVGARAE
jgi:alpha-amylase